MDNFSGGLCGIKASRVVYSCLMTQSAAHAQSTNSVLMIRPARFYPNPETATDNAFQRNAEHGSDALTLVARNEFDAAVQTLRAAGVNVHVFEDTTEPQKPDAVFPNNWISTHHDGRIALFPMYSALRRRERRQEIVELSADQIANFAGNAIELHNQSGEKLLVLSSRAGHALTEDQRKRLSRYARLIPFELPTIELGGGSARCMVATIHLPPRL